MPYLNRSTQEYGTLADKSFLLKERVALGAALRALREVNRRCEICDV